MKIELTKYPMQFSFGDNPPADPPADGITPAIQAIIDAKVAEAVDAAKTAAREADDATVVELEALRKKATAGSAEQLRLAEQIKTMNTRNRTAEELAATELARATQEANDALDAAKNETATWQDRYTSTRINNALLSAAAASKAVSPDQIKAMLAPATKLVPDTDEAGTPTGTFTSMTTITVDGKPMELETGKALKTLREDKAFYNLFQDTMKGGPGGSPNGEPMDIKKIAQDALLYRKARKEGKLPN